MLHFLRRHRQRLGRTTLGLIALAWMTVALQPCVAQEREPAPAPMMQMHHGMAMDHGASHDQAAQEADPCAPGSDCPVFKAVDNQAAPKTADSLHLSFATAPALVALFPLPAQPIVRNTFDPRVALVSFSPPPILEFRVLRI